MNIYQEEMQRKTQHYGCITGYDEESQMLNIFHKGVSHASITDKGIMLYKSQDLTDPDMREVCFRLLDDAETVRK